jgi:hypothetical protein
MSNENKKIMRNKEKMGINKEKMGKEPV